MFENLFMNKKEIKTPSNEFLIKLDKNRFFIIKGKSSIGKTTIANVLHSYFSFNNSIVFTFDKSNSNNSNWFVLEKKNNLNDNLFCFNTELCSICDFISNEEFSIIIKKIIDNPNLKIIFDLNEEKKLFKFLFNIEYFLNLKNNFQINYNEIFYLDAENKLKNLKIKNNYIEINVFKTFNDFLIDFREKNITLNFVNNLYFISMEENENILISNNISKKFLDCLLIIPKIENALIFSISSLLKGNK